jgi:hypothetical protein
MSARIEIYDRLKTYEVSFDKILMTINLIH